MKKIILTENQLDMIRKRLNEGVSDNYSREIEVNIYAGNSLYKGNEINDISRYNMTLSYNIDIEARQWGIKDISLYGISGPGELELEIDYYVDDSNTDSDVITIPLDWDKLETESNSGEGVITIGDTLDIDLTNDENGNLVIRKMTLPIYTL